MPLSEHVVNDYQTLRLSLKAHPMSFLRERLRAERVSNCQELRSMRDGQFVKVAGVILVRQRPGSAKGVVFMTLEDETGVGNCVVWPKTLERYRKTVMQARLMLVTGRVQRHESIVHVVATALEDRSDWLMLLSEWANEMPIPIANADEVKSPGPDPSAAGADQHPRWARPEIPVRSRPMHPRQERVIPKSRDFH
jgi:error-prone DNA polymerase